MAHRHRPATATAIIILITAPALALTHPDSDQPDRSTELELGGGWMLDDPLGIPDLEGMAGPTIDATWIRWTGRTGLAVGVLTIFGQQDDFSRPYFHDGPVPTSLTPVPHIYPHVGWRRRWIDAGGRGFVHVGIGAGPLFYQDRVGPGRYLTSAAPIWHLEVMATRALRDGLSLRFGGGSIQWLYVPLTLQASARAVWQF